jgi:hypothetical protein
MAHPSRIFKTPEALEKAFEEYKVNQLKKAEKWLRIQYVGKDGARKTDAQKLPLIMDGFEIFCYKKYGVIEQYFKNQDNYYTDFIPICSRIKKEIREDQITGGMLGFYNASITQRLNGLADKQQTEIKASINIPKLPDIGTRE